MASLQSKSIKKLIKDWKFAVGNKDYSPARDYWMSEIWNEIRDEIEDNSIENQEIIQLDKKLLKDTLKYGATSGKSDKPLKRWWWHLDKIANKTYPADLLPDYLKEVYNSWKKNI